MSISGNMKKHRRVVKKAQEGIFPPTAFPNNPFVSTRMIEEAHKKAIYGCAFNQHAPEDLHPMLATVGANLCTIYVLDTDTESEDSFVPIVQYANEDEEVEFYAVTWIYDSDRFGCIIGGSSGHLRCVDGVNGDIWQTFIGHTGSVLDLRTSPTESSFFASSSSDHSVRLWSTRFSTCLAILGGAEGHLSEVISIDFHEKGEYILSGSMDHSVKLWDIGKQTKIPSLVAKSLDLMAPREPIELIHFPVAESRDIHLNYVDCVRFYGELIISKAPENKLIMWKFGTMEDGIAGSGSADKKETGVTQISTLDMPDLEVWFNKFDIDVRRNYLVCGSQFGMIRFWDFASGVPQGECNFEIFGWYGTNRPKKWQVHQLAFSHTGRTVVAVGFDGRIVRFDRTA
uniref:WD_REPEATS_REGION domain-containing protein n=1 Tax=Steinernema glaseri TaxID=37863 RepID=A0A1I8A244_9BILA